MMVLGQLNAAVAVLLPVPRAIKEAVEASPVGPLLGLVGIKLGGGGEEEEGEGGVTVEGPLAQLMRRAAGLYRQPTTEQRLSVAQGWLQLALERVGGSGQRGGQQN
jgi:hypothetical protein